MTRYEYASIAGTNTAAVTMEDLNEHGAHGWCAYAVISRPGMAERVLLRRELPPAPAKKGAK